MAAETSYPLRVLTHFLGDDDVNVGRTLANALPLGSPSCNNLQFPAIQVPSADPNNLDDYEEGIWIPTLTFDTPGDLNVVYITAVGKFTKIGRLVVLNATINTSTFTYTTASGFFHIANLPFTPAGAFEGVGSIVLPYTRAGATQTMLETGTSAFFYVLAAGSATVPSELTTSNLPSATNLLIYLTAQFAAST